MTSQSGWTSTSWSKPLSCYYDQDCETKIFKHLWARPSMIWLGNTNKDFNGGHKVISRLLAISMVPLGSALLVDQIPGIVNDQSAQAWFPGVYGNVNKLSTLRPPGWGRQWGRGLGNQDEVANAGRVNAGRANAERANAWRANTGRGHCCWVQTTKAKRERGSSKTMPLPAIITHHPYLLGVVTFTLSLHEGQDFQECQSRTHRNVSRHCRA